MIATVPALGDKVRVLRFPLVGHEVGTVTRLGLTNDTTPAEAEGLPYPYYLTAEGGEPNGMGPYAADEIEPVED